MIKQLFRYLVKRFTPLKYAGFAFTDHVSGRAVNYYRDGFGVYWLKDSKWALFRVKSSSKPKGITL